MPYAPGVQYNAMPLFYGLQDAGKALAEGHREAIQTKNESDFLNGQAQYYFGQDPDNYQKFLSGSIGAKRGMITGKQAEIAQANTSVQQGIASQHANAPQIMADAKLKIAQMNQDRADERAVASWKASQPQPVNNPNLQGYYFSPRTGQLIPPGKPVPTTPPPLATKSVNGQTFYQSGNGAWRVAPSGSPMAGLLGGLGAPAGAGAGQPAMPANPSPGGTSLIPGGSGAGAGTGAASGPAPGTIKYQGGNAFQFRGGDPKDPSNWVHAGAAAAVAPSAGAPAPAAPPAVAAPGSTWNPGTTWSPGAPLPAAAAGGGGDDDEE